MDIGLVDDAVSVNSRVVKALIDNKPKVLSELLSNGLDVNFVVEVNTVDLVAAWERRLGKQYGFSLSSPLDVDLCHDDPDFNELSALEMIRVMNVHAGSVANPYVEHQPLLMAAIRFENYDIINHLLELNVVVNCTDVHGYTPLMYAIEKKASDTVFCLLEHGADPNFACPSGQTPLLAAILSRRDLSVQALAMAGADIETLDTKKSFVNALWLTISTGLVGCIECLIHLKGNTRFVNTTGKNLLDACLDAWQKKLFPSHDAQKIFTYLSHWGAQFDEMVEFPKIRGDYYHYGSLPVLKFMLKNGLSVSPIGKPPTTMPALHEAVCNSSPDILQFLVYNLQLNLETRDNNGQTVLFYSCSESHKVSLEKIKILVDHGADKRSTDNSPSLLELCISSGYGQENFVWLMKRVPVAETLEILPVLDRVNCPHIVESVYKHLAALEYRKKLGGLVLDFENTPHHQFYIQCVAELKRMSSISIGRCKLTDFLAVNELCLIARNTNLVQQLFDMNLETIFPIYWSVLIDDLKEVVERQRLVTAAFKGVQKITKFKYSACPTFMDLLTHHVSKLDLINLSLI